MNEITQGYYKYEPEHLKIGAKVGTQAFFWSNQNVKIGNGSNKVSNETVAKAASSTIGQAVASGYYKLVPTEDKKYENDNPHVQKQVKAAKAEAQRRTRESKDKDYYARVDGKNKTVTVEESNRPKGYGSYLFRDVILNPLQSGNNFFNAEKSLLSGDLGGAFKNTVTGVENLFSPFTLGIGSWAGDNYARFKPEEVQYGTREEVLKRKQTENLLVKLPTDIVVSSMVSSYVSKQVNKISKDVDLGKKGGTSQSNTLYQTYAEKATKNANSTSVMLGKYNQDGISYIKAAGNKHTY